MNNHNFNEITLIEQNEKTRQTAKTLLLQQKRAQQLASIAMVDMSKKDYEQAFLHLLETWTDET
jgi:phage anti-repressor protein